MSTKLITQLNPFSTEHNIQEIENSSIAEIIAKLDKGRAVNTGWRVLLNDEIITDYQRQTNDGDTLYVKLIPEGDASSKDIGAAEKWAGGLMTVAGAVLVFTGVGSFWGAALLGAGIGIFLGGVALYNMDLSLKDTQTPEQSPSIRGSKNQARPLGTIPILLGKRRVYSDVAANSYTWVDENGDQYLYQLFCSGQKDQVIDTTSIKIGETAIELYSESGSVDKVLDGTDGLISLYISQGKDTPPLMNKCVHEDMKNTVLVHETEEGIDGSIITTTPADTEEINVDIFFYNGLGKYDDDGTLENTSVEVEAMYKKESDDDSHYQLLGYFNSGSNVISGNELKTKRLAITKSGLEKGKYTVKVSRKTADSSSSKTIDTVYLGSIRSISNQQPVSSIRCRELTLVGLKIKASSKLNSYVEQLNFVSQSINKTYDNVSNKWEPHTTSNPASAALYVMQGELSQQKLTDSEIDWNALEKLYDWCALHEYECNEYIYDSISVSEILNSIASTCRAEIFRQNGKITVIQDILRDGFVQVFTPRNSWNYKETILKADIPDALSMQFPDAESGYAQQELKVYNTPDGNYVSEPDTVQDVSLWGVTSNVQARKLGMYKYAVTKNRPFIHNFSCDFEYMLCSKGDWIKYAGDIALAGITQGRISGILKTSDGKVRGFYSDELIPAMEEEKNYAVRIRRSDGTAVLVDLKKKYSDSMLLEFEEAMTLDITEDCLFTFGLKGEDSIDLIITNIQCNDDMTAEITAVSYSPEIFDVDDPNFVLPDFINRISSVPSVGDSGEIANAEIQTFITYHDGFSKPDRPLGDGSSNGWHLIKTPYSRWQSTKNEKTINLGQWSDPEELITRGRGLLKIYTEPETYQTSIGDVSVFFRIKLDTLSNTDEILVGDIIEYDIYHYEIVLRDSTYAYLGAATSIQGPSGIDGADGKDGTSISITSTSVAYQSATSGTTTPTGAWLNYIPSVSNGNFLWCRTKVNYSDGTTTTSYSVSYIPNDGKNGANGANGATGVGIKSITEYYLASASSSGVTTSTSGWTTTIQTVSSSKKYLWNYEKITYTDNSTTNTSPVIIGNYAADGKNGTNGTNGKDGAAGKGISSITEHYLATSSGTGVTTSTTGWTDTIQTITATNKYLWNYETITYTDSTTTNTSPAIIGVYGDKGDTGIKGPKIERETLYAVKATAPSKPTSRVTSTAVATSATWTKTKYNTYSKTLKYWTLVQIVTTTYSSATDTTGTVSTTWETVVEDYEYESVHNITTADIVDNAITNAKIANEAVKQANIEAGAITTAKLADDAVTLDKVDSEVLVNTENLIKNSDLCKLADETYTFVANSAVNANNPVGYYNSKANASFTKFNNFNYKYTVTHPAASQNTGICFYVPGEDIIPGELYTITFLYKVPNVAMKPGFWPSYKDVNNSSVWKGGQNAITPVAVDKWCRYTLQWECPYTDLQYGIFGFGFSGAGEYECEIAMPQMFKGSPTMGMVDTSLIVDGAIGTSKIKDSAITSDLIAASAITEDKIKNSAITTTKITDSAITTAKIATNAIIADKVSAGAITAAKIATNAVTADKIYTNSVTSEKIVATAINRIDPLLSENSWCQWTSERDSILTNWSANHTNYEKGIDPVSKVNALVIKKNDNAYTNYFNVEPDEILSIDFDADLSELNTTDHTLYCGMYPQTAGSIDAIFRWEVLVYENGAWGVSATTGNAYLWSLKEHKRQHCKSYIVGYNVSLDSIPAPVNTASAIRMKNVVYTNASIPQLSGKKTVARLRFLTTSGKTWTSGEKMYLSNIIAESLSGGQVTAGNIVAGAITAEKIATNAVTADKINAGAITTDKIAANAVTAGKIASHSITTAQMAVGNGVNLLSYGMDTFDQWNKIYSDYKVSTNTITLNTDLNYVYAGSKSIKILSASTNGYMFIGLKNWKVKLIAGKKYCISVYVRRGNTGTTAVQLFSERYDALDTSLSVSEGTQRKQNGISLSITDDAWHRMEHTFTAEEGWLWFVPRVDVDTSGKSAYFSAFQLEEVEDGQSAGPFSPCGTTIINGGNIITDTIKANTVNGNAIIANTLMADSLNVLAKNRINNFSVTETTEGWSFADNMVTYDASNKRLQIVRTNAGSNPWFNSNTFTVAPNEILKFDFYLETKSSPTMTAAQGFYFGLKTEDTYTHYKWDGAKWTAGSTSSNAYFITNFRQTGKRKITTYILGYEADFKDLPAGYNETENSMYALKLANGKTTTFLRTGYNSGVAGSTWYLYSPEITEVNGGKIVADNIIAGAVTTDKLDANAVTAEKIDVEDLATNTAFIDNLTVNKLVSTDFSSEAGSESGYYMDGKIEHHYGDIIFESKNIKTSILSPCTSLGYGSGFPMFYKGEWESGVTYYARATVKSGAYYYFCKGNAVTSSPETDRDNWERAENILPDSIAIGGCALTKAVQNTAVYNIAVGTEAMRYFGGGAYNIAIGGETMYGNVDSAANYNAKYSIAIGYRALKRARWGDYNIAMGVTALLNCYKGSHNIAIGKEAGFAVDEGNQNILIGDYSGDNITTGSRNTFISSDQAVSGVMDNQINIGQRLMYFEFKKGVHTQNDVFICLDAALGHNVGFTGAMGYCDNNNVCFVEATATQFRVKDEGNSVVGTFTKGSQSLLSGDLAVLSITNREPRLNQIRPSDVNGYIA